MGSDKYKEIMLKAVEIHPYDSKSNLNAATIALEAGELAKAGEYLDRAGDSAEAVYTRLPPWAPTWPRKKQAKSTAS